MPLLQWDESRNEELINVSDSGLAVSNDNITVNEAALPIVGSNPGSPAETASGTVVGDVSGGTGTLTYTLNGNGVTAPVAGDTVKVFNDRGEYHCKADVTSRARPGVVNGLGIWWRKMGLNGTNVNEVTSQLLTDLGRAPVFYDCQVEVALLKKA